MKEENNNEKTFNKPLIYAICGVALLIVTIAGSAYAYFTATASNTTAIQGNTLDVKMSIASVTRVSKGTGDLIPIHDGTVSGQASQLSTATNSTNDCVDTKGYTVCQIYQVVINNAGANATTVDTSITLSSTSTDIKWAKMSARNTFNSTLPTNNYLAQSVTLPAKSGSTNGSVTQYFVVYLKNTGADQTTADSGKSFTGTVTVTASTGAQIEATFS